MNTGNANVAISEVTVNVDDMSHADQTRLMLMLLQDML
jgi:hypothetical protein